MIRTARLWVLAAAVLFSTGGTAIKLSDLSSWQISGLRSAIAALVLTAVMPSWRSWWRPPCLAVGVVFGATLALFVLANTLTTAANAIFLQYSAVLYVLVLGPKWLGEPNRKGDALLILVQAAGVGLLFFGQDVASSTAPDPALGNWVGAATGVTWALTLIGLRWLSLRDDVVEASGAAVIAGNVFACLVSLPMALPVSAPSTVDWGVVLYLGFVQTALAYGCLLRGTRALRAIEVSLLLLLEPIASALWAWMVLGEIPSPSSLVGCALIFAGVVTQTLRVQGDAEAC